MQQRFHDKFNPKKLAVEIKNKKKKKKKKAEPESLQSKQKPVYVPKIQTLPTSYTGYFEIDKYSHHFVIRNISPIGQQLVFKFANTQIQWKMDGFGMYARRVAHKVFGAKVRPLNHYRFHRGQLKEFARFLANNGVDIANIVTVEYGFNTPDTLDAEITKDKTPRDYQVPIIAYMISPKPSNIKLVEVQAGKGKASSLHSHIKIPGGWSTMGEMKVGTEVVTPKGTITKVNGVYPQGNLDIYRVTFADGRTAECCEEHLWKVHLEKRQSKNYWEVFSLRQIMESSSFKAGRAYIPLIEPEDHIDIDLPIHPYLLGVILGDGGISSNAITISKPDLFIKEKVQSLLEPGLKIGNINDAVTYSVVIDKEFGSNKNVLKEKLAYLGLMGTQSHTKFVPKQYLHGSRQQRLDLLNGLLDTDGFVDVNSVTNYTSTSFELAQAVQYLVRSLGGLANISIKSKYYTYQGEKKLGRVAYQVNIRHKRPSELFTLPRKKERTNDSHQYCKHLKLRIDKIEYLGNMPAQCISVEDQDHLYITNDFTVTHNTYMSMAAAAVINTRIIMFLKFQYIEKWEKDLAELLHLEPDEICVINGSDKLITVINRIAEGVYAPKVVLLSSRTFQNWVKEYEEKGDDIREIYGCSPHELCEYIRVGLRVIDEVHQEFHLNFKIDLYTHVRQSISLSATLVSDDTFVAKMMETAYPMDERYNGLEFDRYVDSICMRYRVRQPEILTPSERNNPNYSHNAFEKGIMMNKDLFQGYLSMIEKMVNDYYDSRAKPGEKCLVYCSSIAMCTVVSEFLKRSFPDKNVQRYVEDDPYHFLLESDISVSTVGSAGTGHDIPDLITVILTAAINSTAANIQGFGRLRNLAGKQMIFVFLSCDDVSKHESYRENKMKLLQDKSLTLKEMTYPGQIG